MYKGMALGAMLAVLAACGAPASEDPPNGGAGGLGGAGTGGAGGGAVEEPSCALDIVWEAGPALPEGRDHHHTFGFETEGGARLYVAGGWNYTQIFADTWGLSLGPDPGDWEAAPALPRSTAGAGVVVAGERVVLAGGQTPGAFLGDVLTAARGEDGRLSEWSTTSPLPDGRFHGALVHHRGQLIFTGGLAQSSFAATDTLYRAPLQADGSVGTWVVQQLPGPRSHHAGFVVDDWLYVAGGLEGSPAAQPTLLSDVWRAPIASDGAVGAWEPMGELPAALATMAPLVRGRCAYLFGGLQGFVYSDVVLASPIDDEGRTGAWAALPTRLPVGRSHMHHVALLGERIYLGGGSVAYQTVTPEIAVGSFVMAD